MARKPTSIKIKHQELDHEIAEIKINRSTGDIYYFPKFDLKTIGYDKLLKTEASHSDIKLYPKIPDHISWHKDGKLHVKYGDKENYKTSIDQAEESLLQLKGKDFLPLLSHSVGLANNQHWTVLLFAIGKKAIEEKSFFPKPYCFFAKNSESKNVQSYINISLQNPDLCLSIMQIPYFIPHDAVEKIVSLTIPIQEDELEKILQFKRDQKSLTKKM